MYGRGLGAMVENLVLVLALLVLQRYTSPTWAQATTDLTSQVNLLTQLVETQSRMLGATQLRLDGVQADLESLLEQLRQLTTSCQVGPACPSSPETQPSCLAWLEAGSTTSAVYHIKTATGSVNQVYCDMDTDGGGWMVIQRRQDGSVDFQRTWQEYKDGFGDLQSDFWLGNELVHEVSTGERHQLRVDLEDYKQQRVYAVYDSFSLSQEEDNYKLSIGSFIAGNAGDGMRYHRNRNFTTIDRDNDDDPRQHCAASSTGGWWYGGCSISQLNSRYYSEQEQGGWHHDGIHWNTWHYDDIRFARMMIRPT